MTVEAIIKTGRELIQAKNKLKHGQFGDWLSAEFSMAERSARRYMSVAAAFGDKTDMVADLPLSTLYLLAPPSVPAAFREDILNKIETGASIDERMVRFALAEAKRTKTEARKKEPRPPRRAESKRRQAERQATEERLKEERRQAEGAIGDITDLLRRHLDQEQIKKLVALAEIAERGFFGLPTLARLLREDLPDG